MFMPMLNRFVSSFICLLITLSFTGCNSSAEMVELGLVTGTVTDKGAPVSNAIVEFFPDDGRTSVGTTNAEGVYSLKYNDENGAVVGPCRVQITPGAAPAPSSEDGSDVMAPPMAAPPSVVNIPEKVTVTKGENKLDFEIEPFKTATK